MIKGTPELVAQRREEIVNACEALYQTMSFKDITLKEIGQVTSEAVLRTLQNWLEAETGRRDSGSAQAHLRRKCATGWMDCTERC